MKNYTQYGISLLGILWAAGCFAFFAFAYPHHLFYHEQMQLFLWSPDYLATYFARPAWLACMAGDFLTQFFYYLYAGQALLTLVLLAVGDAVRRVLRRVGVGAAKAYLVALVVMTAEAAGFLHYDTRLSATCALLGGLWMLLADCWLIGHRTRFRHHVTRATQHLPLPVRTVLFTLGQFVMLVVTYWCFGCGVILYALFLIYKYMRAEMALAVVGCLALVLTMRPVYCLSAVDLFRYPGKVHLTLPEWLLERDFAVADNYYFGRTEAVVKQVEAKTDADVSLQEMYYYYLVQAERGMLPESLLRFSAPYLGTFEQIGPQTPMLTIRRMPELYWALGDMTFAERAAMQAMVFTTDNRNARMVKRLAEVSLVTGHREAAMKYLRILASTMAYRSWAETRLAALSAPRGPEQPVMGRYTQKATMMNRTDTLRTTDQSHLLMMQLLDSNPDNYVARDYLLCSDLILRDIPSFHRDYRRYCVDARRPSSHRLYDEALCIWLAGNQATPDEWREAGIAPEVIRDFAAYNRQRGAEKYRGTYWYYFDKKQ